MGRTWEKKKKKPVHKGPGCDVGGWKPLKLPLTALFIDCQRPRERKSTQDTTSTRPKYWHTRSVPMEIDQTFRRISFKFACDGAFKRGHSVCQLFILKIDQPRTGPMSQITRTCVEYQRNKSENPLNGGRFCVALVSAVRRILSSFQLHSLN